MSKSKVITLEVIDIPSISVADGQTTRHGQSPTALYTELDAECDQLLDDSVGKSTAFGCVHRRRQVLSTTGRCDRSFMAHCEPWIIF